MRFRSITIKPTYVLLVLGVFVVFTAYHTYVGSFQLTRLSTDQLNIGVMVLKRSRLELFARDYAFGDTSLFRFYTPFWLWLVEQVMGFTGDYAVSLLVLMPVIMLVYLVGMFILVYYVTKSAWIGALVSLVSSLQWVGFPADIWGVAGLKTVMTPRGLFCMLVPGLFLLMLRWFRQNDRWWQLPLLAFLGGLGANLHPPSGMVFTQLLLSMILLTRSINKKTLVNVLWSALSAVVGAMPMLLNFVGNTGEELGAVSFDIFRQVMHERLGTMFPFSPPDFFGLSLNACGQEIIVWTYLGGMLLWGCLHLLYQWGRFRALPSKAFYGLLFVLQVPLAYLLTGFEATALMILVISYGVYRVFCSELDELDRWLLYLVMLTCSYSFVASYVLELVWNNFELWSLTSLVGTQSRAARFIYLPLFLYVARFMEIALRPGRWKGYFLIVAAACLIAAASPSDLFWSLMLALLVFAWSETKLLRSHSWVESILEAATLGVTLKAVLALVGVEGSGWLALYLAVGYGILALGLRCPAFRPSLLIGAFSLVLVVVIVASIGVYHLPILSPLKSLALTPSQLWSQNSPEALRRFSLEHRERLELYDWARVHTAIDSLFYHSSLEFRFMAQRSLTHCWKDLATVYYHGGRMVEFYNRYNELERARGDVNSLLTKAVEYEVDYIVTIPSQVQLILPAVFSNNTFVVYRYDPTLAAVNLALVRGEWEDIAGYEQTFDLDAGDTWIYFILCRVCQARGEIKTAQAHYLDAIEADRANVSARMSLAHMYVAQGRIEEAIKQYEEAIQLRPDYLVLYEGLGDAYLAQGRVDAAIAEYRKAIEYAPGAKDYHLSLGLLLHSKGLNERAVEEYVKAINLDPNSWKAYHELGDAYLAGGRPEDALEALEEAISIKPDYLPAHIAIGNVYEVIGETERAIVQYLEASRIEPSSVRPYLALGNLYYGREGEASEAVRAYQQAIAMQPTCAACYVRLGRARKIQGEDELAIAAFQRATELDSDLPYPHALLGDLYHQLGEIEAAMREYRIALGLDPGDQEVRANLEALQEIEGE
jgi:tetratricopeptide (TPR) repeat protein